MYPWIIVIFMIISVNIAIGVTACRSVTHLSKSNVTADMSKAVTVDNVNNDLRYANLNSKRAFCARIQHDFYIEVDFGGLRMISELRIQGYKLNGKWYKLDAFFMEFSFNRATWYQYKDINDAPMYFYVGDSDSHVLKVSLSKAAIGQYMRIYPRWRPEDHHVNQMICVRFDVYGCRDVAPPTMEVSQFIEAKVKKVKELFCNVTGMVGLVVNWKNYEKITNRKESNVIHLRQRINSILKLKISFKDLSFFQCSVYPLFARCSRNYTCYSHYVFNLSLRKESISKVTMKIVFPGRVANMTVRSKSRSGVTISWKKPSLNDLSPSMVNYLFSCNVTGTMVAEILPFTINSKLVPTYYSYHPYQCALKVIRRNSSTIFPFIFNQIATKINFRSRSIRPNVKPTIKAFVTSNSARVDVKPNFHVKEFGLARGYKMNATMIEYGRRFPKLSLVRDVNEQKMFPYNNGLHDKSFEIHNLKPWSKYRIQVSVFNDDMLFSNKATIEIETDEGKPTGSPSLEVTSQTSHMVTVKIKKTANFSEEYHNGIITDYILCIQPDNKTRKISHRYFNFFEVPDLKPNHRYVFKAKARTKAGYGPYGQPIAVRTPSGFPGQPVLSMDGTDRSDNLVIRWQKSSEFRESIEKYEMRVTLKNRSIKSYFVEKASKSRYAFNLHIGSVEQVIMRAYTDAGPGEWSDPLIINLPENNPLKIQSTLIIGFSVAFGLFVAFVVVCFIYFRRHYRSQPRHMKDNHHLDSMLLNRELQVFDEEMDSETFVGSARSSSDASTSNLISNTHDPIPVEEFAGYMNIMKQNNYGILFDDFKNHMPTGKCYAWSVAERPENIAKNRYANICSYDHSRIALKYDDCEGERSDYINANGLYGYQMWENGNYKYISTQGPMEETADDFWHMVWQESCSIIVMITNLKDNHKVKCAQYWPNKSAKVYGKIEVTLDKIDKTADYITRTFQLEQLETKEQRTVRQFHFIPWPDHGVPDYPTALLSLRRRVRHYYEEGKPMVIHCSAGVGRSGCFILIDAMLERIDNEKTVDIFNYLNYMRTRRIYMVQIVEQYIFAHTAILEYITFGNTETFVGELDKKFKELIKGNGMAEEFALLERNKVTDTNLGNTYKVLLREGMFVEAYHVDGFKQRDAFILTKAPSEDTVVYFWKMVLEKHCHTIVMLNKCQEVSQEYFKYWPNVDGHNSYQEMAVLLNSEVANGNIITRKIKVTTNKRRCEVNHFQFVDWPDTDVPDQRVYNNICTLMQAVEKSQHNLGNGPIIVHSGNDYGRSGTFIAIYNSTERLKVEQLIDVLQCVRAIRNAQPLAVDNVSQYQFIYNMLRTYLEGFENYWNYKDYKNCRSPFGSTSLS